MKDREPHDLPARRVYTSVSMLTSGYAGRCQCVTDSTGMMELCRYPAQAPTIVVADINPTPTDIVEPHEMQRTVRKSVARVDPSLVIFFFMPFLLRRQVPHHRPLVLRANRC